jgi:hypothetical protein
LACRGKIQEGLDEKTREAMVKKWAESHRRRLKKKTKKTQAKLC